MAGAQLAAGQRHEIELVQSSLPSSQKVPMRVIVLHGRRDGPGLWLSAAIHGDEVGGVEIIRRVLDRLDPQRLKGTLIAVPIVNTFGFLNQSRTLPDRRDLNRSFPGAEKGSLASRLAHLFMTEIVERCDYGIDLHTAAEGRDNLPQIRADMGDEQTAAAAREFGAPVTIHSHVRDGSLRAAAGARGRKTLLYEAGEPLRFEESAIATGERGIMNVMALLRMGGGARTRHPAVPTLAVGRSTWLRSPRAGVARLAVKLGQQVEERQLLGEVGDPLGSDGALPLRSPGAGVVIGLATNPVVYQGDALVHMGWPLAPGAALA